MITILILMVTGIITGVYTGKYKRTIRLNDRLLNISIYLLLLLLGIGVGMNDAIIKNLYSIGLQALLITIGAIGGSILICWIIYKSIFNA